MLISYLLVRVSVFLTMLSVSSVRCCQCLPYNVVDVFLIMLSMSSLQCCQCLPYNIVTRQNGIVHTDCWILLRGLLADLLMVQ